MNVFLDWYLLVRFALRDSRSWDWRENSEQGRLTLMEMDQVREHLNKPCIQKSMWPEGVGPWQLREPADILGMSVSKISEHLSLEGFSGGHLVSLWKTVQSRGDSLRLHCKCCCLMDSSDSFLKLSCFSFFFFSKMCVFLSLVLLIWSLHSLETLDSEFSCFWYFHSAQ